MIATTVINTNNLKKQETNWTSLAMEVRSDIIFSVGNVIIMYINHAHFTHLEPLVPLLDGGLVVWRVRFEEVHVLLSEFVFTNEAAHFDFCNKQ